MRNLLQERSGSLTAYENEQKCAMLSGIKETRDTALEAKVVSHQPPFQLEIFFDIVRISLSRN